MLDVTPLAAEKITAYMTDNKISSALRVALMQGGCSGPALGLALDEEKPEDQQYQKDGLTFLVEKGLLEQCGTIFVDYVESGSRSGFSIRSANALPGFGGGCSSGSCGSGGCGC